VHEIALMQHLRRLKRPMCRPAFPEFAAVGGGAPVTTSASHIEADRSDAGACHFHNQRRWRFQRQDPRRSAVNGSPLSVSATLNVVVMTNVGARGNWLAPEAEVEFL
jgi:hypothetical protein